MSLRSKCFCRVECRKLYKDLQRSLETVVAQRVRLPKFLGFESRFRRPFVDYVVASCPLLRLLYLRVLRFHPFLNNQDFQIPIR